jgi:hypothetical protein
MITTNYGLSAQQQQQQPQRSGDLAAVLGEGSRLLVDRRGAGDGCGSPDTLGVEEAARYSRWSAASREQR